MLWFHLFPKPSWWRNKKITLFLLCRADAFMVEAEMNMAAIDCSFCHYCRYGFWFGCSFIFQWQYCDKHYQSAFQFPNIGTNCRFFLQVFLQLSPQLLVSTRCQNRPRSLICLLLMLPIVAVDGRNAMVVTENLSSQDMYMTFYSLTDDELIRTGYLIEDLNEYFVNPMIAHSVTISLVGTIFQTPVQYDLSISMYGYEQYIQGFWENVFLCMVMNKIFSSFGRKLRTP